MNLFTFFTATLKQRLEAIHKLRLQHDIKTLCRVLGVNRSTYYKHRNSESADRPKENQEISKLILQIYADYNKRLGAYKITYVLQRDNGICTNHLHQEFNQKSPNIVWTSDFTYIKVAGKWYYLCIVMDLFSRKIIAWNISGKPDVDLVMHAFKKAYDKRNRPIGLMFHSD